ncbi:MAG: membrane protein insertion efficiency factor YidD [Armatimonadetes bacterium]|nr:membrane protein insertion efficiency factor YidD [Armatimonadota bacterium]
MKERTTTASISLPARGALAFVRFYQRFLTGLKPPTCRFYPTCSEYAAQAITHCGLLRGLALAAWRVLRCNPFSAGGYDPGCWAQDSSDEATT